MAMASASTANAPAPPSTAPAVPKPARNSGHTPRPVLFVPEGEGGPQIDMVDPDQPADGGEDEFLGRDDWDTLCELRATANLPLHVDVEANVSEREIPAVVSIPPPVAKQRTCLTSLRVTVVLILVLALVVTSVARILPSVDPADRPAWRWPSSHAQLSDLLVAMKHYVDAHFLRVHMAWVILFFFVQAFSLPGTCLLTICAGAFWSPLWATLLVLATTPASCLTAYELDVALRASLAGIEPVESYVRHWRHVLARAQANHRLAQYILWSRIGLFPYGALVTLSCASVGTPRRTFVCATVVGRAGWAAGQACLGAALVAWGTAEGKSRPISRLLLALFFLSLGPLLKSHYAPSDDRLDFVLPEPIAPRSSYGATASSTPRRPRRRPRRSSHGSLHSVLSTPAWDEAETPPTPPSASQVSAMPNADAETAAWARSPSTSSAASPQPARRPKSVRAPSPGLLGQWAAPNIRPVKAPVSDSDSDQSEHWDDRPHEGNAADAVPDGEADDVGRPEEMGLPVRETEPDHGG